MELYIVAAVVLVVALIGAGLAYFVPRRRRGAAPVIERPAPPPRPSVPEVVEAPETVEAPEVVEPEAPVLEVPEPTAGRLARLRARLSKSQSVFGKGLLALLSRDKLDDDTWEEIEETLIGADVGVQATTEIVGKLREKARVEGTASADRAAQPARRRAGRGP